MIQNKDENQDEKNAENIVKRFATEEFYNLRLTCSPGTTTNFGVCY